MTLRNDMAQLPAQLALYLIHGAAAGVMAERACVRCEQPATVPPVYHAQNVFCAVLAAGDTAELACAACLCDVLREEATQMACEHAFCNSCWRQHLSVQISEGRSRRLMCMGVRCGAVCDEEQARSLIAARPRRCAQRLFW